MVDDLSWNDPELMLSVALSTASFCVILFALVMALRGSRGLGLSHSLASLLFPLSQLILVTFINVSLVIGPLSPVMNVAVLVVSVLCAVSDHFLFKGLRAAGEHDAVEGQARLVREQVEAQRAYERRLDADRARTRAARALIMKELREAEAMLDDDGDVAEALDRAHGRCEAVLRASDDRRAVVGEGRGVRASRRALLRQGQRARRELPPERRSVRRLR